MSLLRFTFIAALLTSSASLAQTPCQDCWNDTCKEFKGLIPRCAEPKATPPPPTRPEGGNTGSAPNLSMPATVCTTLAECNARCSANEMASCVVMGSMYENGIGAPEDRQKAQSWFDFACNAGFKPGCIRLKAYAQERARDEAERKRLEAETKKRAEEDERERKRQEAEAKKRAEEEERERKRLEAEAKKKADEEAATRAAREKLKQLEWVQVGPLAVAKSETTVVQYVGCVTAGKCAPAGDANCRPRTNDELAPQTCVSWDQAAKFCESQGARLPSGPEWLALATNGGKTTFPWGNDALGPTRARYDDPKRKKTDRPTPTPVGSYAAGASERGLFDLVGNAWEWIADEDAPGKRGVRGGAFDTVEAELSPTRTLAFDGKQRLDHVGFRCVRVEKGLVTVSVEPAGTPFSIDGIPVGPGPWRGALGAGAHKVAAKRELHLPGEQLFVVKPGVEASVTLQLKEDPKAIPGTLEVTSTPPGARVTVDGTGVGLTPWSGALAQGKHTVALALQGYDAGQREVQVQGRKTTTAAFELVKKLEPATFALTTEPPGATVTEGKTVLGVSPVNVTLAPGAHELTFTLDGYVVTKKRLAVPLAEPWTLLALERLPAELAVKTTPPGAEISIDGKVVGKAPWRGKVPSGAHEVSLALDGYVTLKQATNAPGIVNVTLVAVPTGLSLGLATPPPGLELRLDGKPAQLVDGVVLAPPGKHTLELKAPGYRTFKSDVTVVKKTVTPVPVSLSAGVDVPPRGLVVLSSPAGAEVLLGDKRLGVTPLADATVRDGTHEVTVRASGYVTASSTVEVKKGAATELSLQLVPAPVALSIDTTPEGAQLFIDGEAKGQTPQMLKLSPGKHRVYVSREGFEPLDEEREIAVGSTPSWRITLKARGGLAPPLPPLATGTPPPAGDALLQLLADEQADAATKRARLEGYAASNADVSPAIAAVAPQALRDELCVQYAGKVRTVRYQASAVDAFNDAAEAELVVNGKALAKLPFDGMLPWCARTIEARRADGTTVARPASQPLDPVAMNSDAFRFPGRKSVVSISAFYDLQVLPFVSTSAIERAERDVQPLNHAFGVRLDYWGKLFHFSIAPKVGQMFRGSLFGGVPGLDWVPLGDLHLGFTFAAGSEQVRYRFAVDGGVVNLLAPGGRIVNAVSFGERFFISLTLDAHYVFEVFIPRLTVGTLMESLWLLGGTIGLGVGF